MAKKWYEEKDSKGRRKIKKKDLPLSTQAARYANWAINTFGDKVKVSSGDRGKGNHSKGNAVDMVGISKLPKKDKELAHKTALEMGLRIGKETKGKKGVEGWTGSHTHFDSSKGPSFTRGSTSGSANRSGRTKEENKENNKFLNYLDGLKNKDLGQEVMGPPEKKPISRGPASIPQIEPERVIMKEDEDDKKIEAVATASLISKNKHKIAEQISNKPELSADHKLEIYKYLQDDKAIKKASDKAAGLTKKAKNPSPADNFKEALTFFAPQLLGGMIGSALGGERGAIAGYEESGKLRDSYINYKKDIADISLKNRPKSVTPKAYQQSEFVLPDGSPGVYNPNTGKYEDGKGNVVDPTTLKSGISVRHDKNLVRSDSRLELTKDKFVHHLKKDGQLSEKQVEGITNLDTALASAGRIGGLFESAETGPIIGRVQSIGQLADAAPEVFTKLKAESSNLRLAYQLAMSGKQVNEKEMSIISSMIPSETDAPGVFKAKLDTFKTVLGSHREEFLNAVKTGQPLKREVVEALLKEADKIGVQPVPQRRRSTMTEAQKSRLQELRNKHGR